MAEEDKKGSKKNAEVASQESSDTQSSDPDVLDPEKAHQLQFSWSFWYALPSAESKSRGGWQKRHTRLKEIRTMQDFWHVFNNFVAPSSLVDGGDIHFFRSQAEPEWEHHYNTQGGSFQVFLSMPDTNSDQADHIWLHILLRMIGDHFEDADEIVGLILSRRSKGYRFSLWIKTASDQEARKRMGRQLREWCKLDPSTRIQFRSHGCEKRKEKPKELLRMRFITSCVILNF